MRIDTNKVILGLGVLGGAALLYYLQPAKKRAGVGDKVLVGTVDAGVQSAVKIQITSADDKTVTGKPYETLGGIPAPQITVSRENILGFA